MDAIEDDGCDGRKKGMEEEAAQIDRIGARFQGEQKNAGKE
jgi:hypothetical protein